MVRVMRQRTKVTLAAIGGLILVLVLAGALIVPWLIDLGPVRAAIVSQLSQRLGADVSLGGLRLSMVPLPHLEVTGVTFSIPNVVSGTVPSVYARPHLLSLIRGRIELAKLQIRGASVTVAIPPATPPAAGDHSGGASLGDSIAAVLSGITAAGSAIGPGAAVQVKDGHVELTGAGPAVALSDVNARLRLSPEQLVAELTCGSTLAKHVSLNLTVDPSRATGQAEIDIQRLQPQALRSAIPPGPWPQIQEAEMDLTAHLTATSLTAWAANVHGSLPALMVQSGGQPLSVRGVRFEAAVSADANTMKATLARLDVDAPRAHLAGYVLLDHARPLAELEVNGTDIDVAAVGAAATSLVPDMAVVHDLFDVLRGGTASTVSVRAAAPSAADLGDTVAIKGTLAGGRIHVPGIDLDLEDVSGGAVVVDNVLDGEGASGRIGNIHATAGSLRLGLTGDAPELRLEAAVQADAAELHDLLQRIVHTGPIREEISRLSDVKGSLGGKIVLTGTTHDVALFADVSQSAATGRYQGLDLPLQVTGGTVTIDPSGIAATGVTIAVGGSQFSDARIRLNQRGVASLGVDCGASRILLGEIYPRILAAGLLRGARGVPDSLTGTIVAESLSFSGPIDAPAAWQWALAGAIEELEIGSDLFREHVAVRKPLSLTGVRLSHAASTSAFAGTIAAPGGLQGVVDVVWGADDINIRNLRIRDRASDATVTLHADPRKLNATFAGRLAHTTVAALVPNPRIMAGSVSGDFRAEIPLGRPASTTIQGRLQAEGVSLPLHDNERATVERLTVDASTKRALVHAAVDMGAGGRLDVNGTVSAAPDNLVVDLTVASPRLDVESLAQSLHGENGSGRQDASTSWLPPVRGVVQIQADTLTYHDFTWKPFRASVKIGPDGTTARIANAKLCGIATPGSITLTPRGVDLAVKPSVTNASLDLALTCLFNRPDLATGTYTFGGTLTAKGEAANIATAIQGPLDFSATNGRVRRVPLIANIFSVISMATGSLENIFAIGSTTLPYNQFTVKGTLRNQILSLTEATMDGPTVKLAAEGTINLADQTVDLTVLVAPLVAASNLVARIPVIGGLSGNLVSIPVRVSGPLSKPSAVPLSPTAVSQTLTGVMKRTLSLPRRAFNWLR